MIVKKLESLFRCWTLKRFTRPGLGDWPEELLVISLNLVLCIFALLQKLKRENGQQNTAARSLLVFVSFSLTWPLPSQILSLAPLEPFNNRLADSNTSSSGPPSGHLLTVSSTPLRQPTSITLATEHPSESRSTTSPCRHTYSCYVLEIYFQLSFIIYVGRLVMNERSGSTRDPAVLRGFVLCLAVTNSYLWVIGTVSILVREWVWKKGNSEGWCRGSSNVKCL